MNYRSIVPLHVSASGSEVETTKHADTGALECARALLDEASACAYVLDAAWRFQYLNKSAVEQIALGRDLIGGVLWEEFPGARETCLYENLRRAMYERSPVKFESYFPPLAAWLQIRATPLPGGGIAVWFRNIDARKSAEEAVATIEERCRLAARATLDLTYDWDFSADHILWNEALIDSFGYAVEELGTNYEWWLRHVHPEDCKRVSGEIDACLKDGSDRFVSEYRFLRADGSYAEIYDRGFFVRNSNGEAVRLVGAMQDNSTRNGAIRALREREADLASVCGHATIGILHRAADGTLLMVNKHFCDILGRSAEEIAQVDVAEYSHPDDTSWNNEARYAEVTSHDAVRFDKRYIRPDGSIVWCEVSISRVEAIEGRQPSFIILAQDITERKAAADSLKRSEERLRLIQDASELADFESGPDAVSICSDRFFEQAGLPVGDNTIEFAAFAKLIHPDDARRLETEITASLEHGDLFMSEFRLRRADSGEERWISCRTKMIRDEAGEHVRTIGAHLDITDRKRAEEALRESEERFRLAAEAAGFGVWDYDATTCRREWSDRLREIFGYPADQKATLEAAVACLHPEDRGSFVQQLDAVVHGRGSNRFEASFRIRRARVGDERWIAVNAWKTLTRAGALARIIITVRDITEEKAAEERVVWSANHDALTGLANRTLFQAKLEEAIRHATQSSGSAGLLMLDLDHFKQINDSLGHDVGDRLLKMFAERLHATVRSSDTVARLGGDEFAIVMPNVGDGANLARRAETVLERLREPLVEAGHVLDCRASIGASRFPVHGKSAEELMKNADMALYSAKSSGRATSAVYDPKMRTDVHRRASMLQLAREAIRDDRLVPYYQPKLDLGSGSIVGFEALLRWRDPRGGIHLPSTVRAAFEDLDVAAAISDRMIERVIADIRAWLDRGADFQHVAVNASAAEFRRDNFAERVLEQLRAASIPANCFQLEVTETVFLGRGAESVHRALGLLSANGVQIALDDFGTGYASLRHLKDFPVNIIKIDRSFVRDMEVDPGDEAIVRAVINLGRSLGIKVVAEGIEKPGQAERLIKLGCDYGQGFLFSKAVPASRVPGLIERCRVEPRGVRQ
jgi:diguanylate cyclase (GGDEF)-like protein/PAS domain S-box-containing protein